MTYNESIFIHNTKISIDSPVYFIADIASSHDGELERAKNLIHLARESGINAVKFQHFQANKIVSDFGFRTLGGKFGHQASWGKSVYEIYKQYECDRTWTNELKSVADRVGIDFLTTPYDADAVELLRNDVPAFKIGSGDITWIEFVELIAKQGKPVLLATGASSMADVERAVDTIVALNGDIVLMQCNTNYTGDVDNFNYINLNVLKAYASKYPGMLLGLSDHTPGYATVLGAVALGVRVIEKHFTDDNSRIGPDHSFSLCPKAWSELIQRVRELEAALGDGIKIVENNELDTVVLQRRCLRFTEDRKAGDFIKVKDLIALRPSPIGAIQPYELERVIGSILLVDKVQGDALMESDWRAINA